MRIYIGIGHRFRCWLLYFIPIYDWNLFWSYIWYWIYVQFQSYHQKWYHSVGIEVWSVSVSARWCVCVCFILSYSLLWFSAFELHVKRFNMNQINKHALQHTSNELKFMFYIGFGFGVFGLFWLLLLINANEKKP